MGYTLTVQKKGAENMAAVNMDHKQIEQSLKEGKPALVDFWALWGGCFIKAALEK